MPFSVILDIIDIRAEKTTGFLIIKGNGFSTAMYPLKYEFKYPYNMENPLEHHRVEAFLTVFESILKNSNYVNILDVYSRISMKCSRCASECQLYQISGDARDIPCYRSSILIRIYKRHFTMGGRFIGAISGRAAMTESDIDEMLESYYHCTACGRCSLYCPLGIDHRLILRLGRFILSGMGIVPKSLTVSVREQLEGSTGNTSAIPLKALHTTLEFLNEEIREIKGVDVAFPIDVENAEYVFFPPVSDFIMEADTLMGIACVLHEANVSWTIASGNYDAINYGLFYSDEVLEKVLLKMIGEVRRLKGKKILIGECGHAFRSAQRFLSLYNDGEAIPVVSVIELTYDLMKAGKIEFDADAVKEAVTYHDPCNIARDGLLVDTPRSILRACIKNYIEMEPHGSRNYCCGGGGGTVTINELKSYRMDVAGKKKAEQLKETGAEIVIAPCANCKKQLGELIQHYKLVMRQAGLHDIIFSAIRMRRRQ